MSKKSSGKRMSKKSSGQPQDYVTAEAALRPMDKQYKVLEGDEWVVSDNVQNYLPLKDNVGAAIKGLKDDGFQILEVGAASITIGGKMDLYEKRFGVQLKQKSVPIFRPEISKEKVSFFASPDGQPILNPTDNVKQVVEGIVIPEQPLFFASAFPPSPSYFHLHPVEDVPRVMQANRLHAQNHIGKGIKLAMVDTGFYVTHPYYVTAGYNVYTTASPLPGMNADTDEYGHGTGIASNALGVAPAMNFVSVKTGVNPTLAFKLAVRQRPNIITNSWGYDIDYPGTPNLPPYLIPLEIEIANAVANGITVLFAAGNGHRAWPASMSEVIAVGGGYFDQNLNLQASSYASSFDSSIYPGRHVPDIAGMVGLAPHGIYIMMPTMPASTVDNAFGGGSFPNGDQTSNNDGWVCASGTSSATPMVAGVVALLLEKKPTLTPDEVKQILQGTARDISAGTTNTGDSASVGWDAATGYGLVDAYQAWLSIP